MTDTRALILSDLQRGVTTPSGVPRPEGSATPQQPVHPPSAAPNTQTPNPHTRPVTVFTPRGTP